MTLFVTTMMTLAFVACSSTQVIESTGETKETGTKEETTEKVPITITFRDDGGTVLSDWFIAAYETWELKDQAEIKLAPITAAEGDYFAKVALSLQSESTAPDIVCEDTFQLASDVAAGYLTDLSAYLVNYDDWNNGIYSGALVEGLTYDDGAVYTIPYCTDTRGLWYNKEIFIQAGIEVPWQPKTWDDILEVCAIIQSECPDVIPFWCNSGVATGEATSMQTYEMLLYGTGEELLDNDDKWIVSSDNILSSLEFIDAIYTNGYGPSLSQVLNGEASNTSAREYMPNGKLAISLDGFWITGNYKEAGPSPWPEYEDILGFALMPTMEGQEPGTITMSGGWGLSIPELSDEKELAFDFIKHCMEHDNYIGYIVASGNIATKMDATMDSAYTEQAFMEEATSALEGAYYRPRNSQYTTVTTYIQSMVESVASGTSPVEAMSQYEINVGNAVGSDNVVSK